MVSLYSSCGRRSSHEWSAHGKEAWNWSAEEGSGTTSGQHSSQGGAHSRIWSSASTAVAPSAEVACEVGSEQPSSQRVWSSALLATSSRQSLYGLVGTRSRSATGRSALEDEEQVVPKLADAALVTEVPDSAVVQQALAELDLARGDGSVVLLHFRRAIQLCSAASEYGRVIELFDIMRSCHALQPDAATCLAVLAAFEATASVPLERAWSLLEDMRKWRFDPLAPAAAAGSDVGSSRLPQLSRDLESGHLSLKRHAEAWLRNGMIPQKAFHAALCCASALRLHGELDEAVEHHIHRNVILPIVEVLRHVACTSDPDVSMLHHVATLGAFTVDALPLLRLNIEIDDINECWLRAACSDLKRREMLRQFARWGQHSISNPHAWLAFDLSSSGGAESWELRSDGAICDHAPLHHDDGMASCFLPALFEGDVHAERHALVGLSARIFSKLGLTGNNHGVRVEGVVMLCTLRPPTVASLYAMCQFLRLFPWVHLHLGGFQVSATEPKVVHGASGTAAPAPARRRLAKVDQSGGAPQDWGKWRHWREGYATPKEMWSSPSQDGRST